MRIYLAAPYRRRLELRRYAVELEKLGHVVTSRWLNGSHDSLRDDTDNTEMLGEWAQEDCVDIKGADTLIVFTVPVAEYRRGGSHVEMGYALGHGLRVIEVGNNRPNVFYCLPVVERFATWSECVAALEVS